ncbi:hypothetical protein THRCLA_02006 [Thraustotheca clavata]|uniref:Uncharacterized protein n=1 Tax=Thraustotheca clavata TaxID=74557 RepID=A0A1W0A6V5_9STRA|nr:hypothetical protein THRCLA_02006 [Thraustotheca clavata]
MRKQAGPMPEFIMNELCCAMVIMALKMNGYIANGEQGTYVLPKQTRPDEVQCVQFTSMKLVHDEVVCIFTPVVYHLHKADSIVHTLRQGAMGMQIADDTFTRQLQSIHAVFALPFMNACRIVEYSSHPEPMMGNLHGYNLVTPQTDDDYRKHWKAVHGMTLPQDVGGYIRVQFPSGEVMTYPASCIATNWHILAKQTRMEANDITRKLVLSMHSFFGVSAVTVRSESNESKMGSLLPASALLHTGTGSMTTNAVLARKRNDHQTPALTKRKKIY